MKVIGIIRSIGERTEEFSTYLLEKQLKTVFLVKGATPIKNMAMECLKIGLQNRVDYMVTCDADVFILPDAVEGLLQEIKANKNVLLTGHTKSRFMGVGQGGIRIWGGKALNEALRVLKEDTQKNLLRPEELIHIKLGGSLSQQVTSLHEYEQYYHHIYAKFFNKAIKSKSISTKVAGFKDSSDMDFKVAFRGFFDPTKDFKKAFPDLMEKQSINIPTMEKRYA